LGNPTGFYLSEGQAHDLDGADVLLPRLASETGQLIADKAYDADKRMRDVLQKAGIEAVIPSKKHRKELRDYDKEMYKNRHLIENFFGKLKQYRAIATRYDKLGKVFLSSIYLAANIIWLN
jgi:transposase